MKNLKFKKLAKREVVTINKNNEKIGHFCDFDLMLYVKNKNGEKCFADIFIKNLNIYGILIKHGVGTNYHFEERYSMDIDDRKHYLGEIKMNSFNDGMRKAIRQNIDTIIEILNKNNYTLINEN